MGAIYCNLLTTSTQGNLRLSLCFSALTNTTPLQAIGSSKTSKANLLLTTLILTTTGMTYAIDTSQTTAWGSDSYMETHREPRSVNFVVIKAKFQARNVHTTRSPRRTMIASVPLMEMLIAKFL